MSYPSVKIKVQAKTEAKARSKANKEARARRMDPVSVERLTSLGGDEWLAEVLVVEDLTGKGAPKKTRKARKPAAAPAPAAPAASEEADAPAPKPRKKRGWLNKLKGEKSE